jgi:Domain of unknown function (DUF4124)
MLKRYLLGLAMLCVAAPLAAAQLYRWVDDRGNVEWRDTPPPATAKNVEQRNVSSNTIQTSTLPYSTQQAVKNFPVTLWVFDCGEPCTKARGHLARRGVPYSERNAQREMDELKKLIGGTEVPLLIIGSRQLKGYLESDWDSALDTAGYPRTASPGVKSQVQAKSPTEIKTGIDAPAKPKAGTENAQ